jgi:hypothetical protein
MQLPHQVLPISGQCHAILSTELPGIYAGGPSHISSKHRSTRRQLHSGSTDVQPHRIIPRHSSSLVDSYTLKGKGAGRPPTTHRRSAKKAKVVNTGNSEEDLQCAPLQHPKLFSPPRIRSRYGGLAPPTEDLCRGLLEIYTRSNSSFQ